MQPHPAPWENDVRGVAGGAVIGSYDAGPVPERHSDADIDRAIEALSDPERLEEAQRLVAAKAPQLQRILDQALEGWLDQVELLKAAGRADPEERLTAVRELVDRGDAREHARGRGRRV